MFNGIVPYMFQPEEMIFEQGDEAHNFYFISEGEFQIFITD